MNRPAKPLGRKAYGSIPHLPNSRMGPADRHCHEGQARIATEKPRDRHDLVIVQEKLDGSCCSVARVGGEIVALGRAGYLATTSPYAQHVYFAAWVHQHRDVFDFLDEGERVVGEWLAQAHGTRYRLGHEPFVAFDIMRGIERATFEEFTFRTQDRLRSPHLISLGDPMSVEVAMDRLHPYGFHGALDPVEGAMWRVERDGRVDFLVKYVRPDKVDGCYLPSVSGEPEVWNWPVSR